RVWSAKSFFQSEDCIYLFVVFDDYAGPASLVRVADNAGPQLVLKFFPPGALILPVNKTPGATDILRGMEILDAIIFQDAIPFLFHTHPLFDAGNEPRNGQNFMLVRMSASVKISAVLDEHGH